MMFNETNKMVCANVNIIDEENKVGIESFMIELYTPQREAGEPGGAELRSPELEVFIRHDPTDGKHRNIQAPAVQCTCTMQFSMWTHTSYTV
jgi:hypothetical protein